MTEQSDGSPSPESSGHSQVSSATPPVRPAAVFFSPRQVIRGVVSTNVGYGVLALTALMGITGLLTYARSYSFDDSWPWFMTIAGAVVLGLPFGWFMVWINTVAAEGVGRMLGGKATSQQLKAAIVWGNAPAVFMIPLMVVGFLLFGDDYFHTSQEAMPAWDKLPVVLALGAVGGLITLWTVILTSHTIAEVQGFSSAWLGFVNLLLAVVLMTIAGLLLGVIGILIFLLLGGDGTALLDQLPRL